MGESREQTDSGTGEVTSAEQVLNRYVGNTIHMFLSVLAVLLLIAAAIMTFEMVVRDFPKLWQPTDEYKALQMIVSDILLIAIAAELGLLLLYHRTSAAVEVIIFVIARKTVSPETSALELLMSVAALVGLLVARFYYLPGRPK
ncbi:MAG TPA: hypothetical protein VGC89_21190 [Pyrinomonadaceae bacterium]|jgi:uncharacterized membrane protein (DUF373 family)